MADEIGSELQEGAPRVPDKMIDYTRSALSVYTALLQADRSIHEGELRTVTQEILDQHLGDLDLLKKLLVQLKKGGFSLVINRPDKQLERPHQLRRTFVVRYTNEGPNLPSDPNNPQNQISLSLNLPGYDPEALRETYYSAGLKSKWEIDRKVLNVENADEIININTIGVYQDASNFRPIVLPRGGISFRIRKEDVQAKAHGFIHLATIPHFVPLNKGLPLAEFREMRSFLLEASRFKASQLPIGSGGK